MKPRIALFLDLENLVHRFRADGDLAAAVGAIERAVRRVAARGTIVAAVACCDCSLARALVFAMRDMNVRVFTHSGGPDRADLDLLARIRTDLPASVDTVVIGSGDHIFTEAARALRAQGLRVELIAPPGATSADLYRNVDDCILIGS